MLSNSQTESAGSSPTKSPRKEQVFLPTSNVFNFGGSTSTFITAKSSPVKGHASPAKQQPALGDRARALAEAALAQSPSFLQNATPTRGPGAPLPAPSDAFPNMGDVTQSQEATSSATSAGWQIPAVRSTPTAFNPPPSSNPAPPPAAPAGYTASIPRVAAQNPIFSAPPAAAAAPFARPLGSPRKPGAAAKIGRREAWLKFMAYEGAVQICLDSLLHGAPSPATSFLINGCQGLKEALALGVLLLPSAGYEQGNETSIYWDDREEGGGAVLERVTVQAQDRFTDPNPNSGGGGDGGSHYFSRKNPTFQEDLTGAQKQNEYKSKSPVRRHETPPAPAAPTTVATLGMSPLRNGKDVAQDHSVHGRSCSATSVGPLAATSTDSLIPIIEASIVRVVGCPMLAAGGGGDGNNRSRSSKSCQRHLTVVMHPAGAPAPKDARAWTSVLPNGAIEGSGVLRLLPDAPRGTVLVELYDGKCQVAAGTVQAAELQRCALQHDGLDEEAPMGAGFLRNLVPAFARRKDTLQQGSISSMTWVRLVDSEGADAGHIVVSAKLVTNSSAATSDSSIANPSSSVATTPPPLASAPPPSTAAAAMLGVGAAVHTNQSFQQDAYSKKNRGEMRQKEYRDDDDSYQQQQQQLVTRIDIRGAGVGGRAHTAGGYLHVNSQHVYDILLESALAAAGCGPSNLELTGPWAWLVEQHAQRYGVRKQYATLAYLRWVVRSDNAAPTKACLGTLAAKLGPLLDERDSIALTSSELALLGHVVERVDQLITSCFEHYFALSEDVLGGLSDGMLSVRTVGAPPKALAPAVELLKMTRGTEIGPDGGISWLASRLRAAARKRFQALLAATEARRAPNDRRRGGPELSHRTIGGAAAGTNEIDDPSMAWSYNRVEELCSCVVSELRADESIAAAGVLPESISLPSITAVEFIRGTISYLQYVLQHSPPPSPSPAAVRLVESVGRLQSFLERHGFDDAAARLNSRDIFGGFVAEWVAGTATNLRRTLRALDRAGPPALSGWADLQTGVKTRVAPLVEGMLSEVEAEMRRYARIVAYWPAYGQDLEAALVSVLREATSAASGQCGLVQSKVEDVVTTPLGSKQTEPVFMHRSTGSANGGVNGSGSKPTIEGKKFGRVAWRWIQVGSGGQGSAFADAPTALRKGINPHQALLLNSLRRLLAVVPQLELALRGWCAGTGAGADPRQSTAAGMPRGDNCGGNNNSKGEERLSRDAPDLGAHWAQLVKEIRTKYYACCTLTVESLAGELSRSSATSVIAVLRREALTSAPAAVTKCVRKVLEQTAPNLRWLAAALDGRVFVALARGLWDNAAKDVLRYAEDLTDGGTSGAAQGAWRARQGAGAALRALDAFYRAELAAAMGSDLLDRDLALPQHAQRAAALLADNTVEVNMSFDVY
ncbi:hypothetical protein Ndes2526B_g03113 [Nannochloris sp. 'desiccata']|nr:hypothetical protein KSW81_006651 [Chlorella desiccata (nom. nud.)]